ACTGGRASHAACAARRSSRWSSPGGDPTSARRASRGPVARAANARSGGEQLVEATALGGRLHLGEPAEQLAVDDDLGKAQHARASRQLDASAGILGEVDLCELQPVSAQYALDARAERAGVGRVHGDATHYFTNCRKPAPRVVSQWSPARPRR